MDAVIDKFGRIVIPKEIRDALGLRPGSSLRIEEADQEIRLRPYEGAPHVKAEHGWLVFTGELQEDVLECVRNFRAGRIGKLSGGNK